MQQTYPTIGPPCSKLYTCLGFSRYLNFLSTLEEERERGERSTQTVINTVSTYSKECINQHTQCANYYIRLIQVECSRL